MHVLIFKIMKPQYPGVASINVKKVIEIRECEKDEKSAIIHCALTSTNIISQKVMNLFLIAWKG